MRTRLTRPVAALLLSTAVALVAAACATAGADPAPAPPAAPPAAPACAPSVPKAGVTVSRSFVCVDTPQPRASVGRSITVTGRAANGGAYRVSVDLLDASGLIATSGETEFPNAAAPPRVATWRVTLKVPPTVDAGDLTLVARAFDTYHRTFGEDDVPVTLAP